MSAQDSSGPVDPEQPSALEGSSTEAQVVHLLAVLSSDYQLLLDRLSLHLRSSDAAGEALHDTYLKLRANPAIGDVRSPRSYLYRMAINSALNRRRREGRAISLAEVDISRIPENSPDPEQRAISTDEMDRALQALHSLPAKRRDIFLAKWRDERTLTDISIDFGLHKRSVQKELTKAELYLRKALRRPRRPAP